MQCTFLNKQYKTANLNTELSMAKPGKDLRLLLIPFGQNISMKISENPIS